MTIPFLDSYSMTRKLPVPISKEDFEKLIEFVKKEVERHKGKRSGKLTSRGKRINQYLICMCLGFGAGMRISEIVGHKGFHIKKTYDSEDKKKIIKKEKIPIEIKPLSQEQIESNYIRVVGGKGQKDRVVPLPSRVFLKAGITRAELISNLPLKTKRRALQKYVTVIGKLVLNKHITFHTLRHGFVTHALESGVPIHQVQMFAGHSRLDTTGIYLHVNPKQALDKYGEVF